MNCFYELEEKEAIYVDGGGVASAVAGGLAGGMIGTFVGLVPAVVSRKHSYITKAAVTGATVGVWAGMGCPLP